MFKIKLKQHIYIYISLVYKLSKLPTFKIVVRKQSRDK